jgi:tetratricopeptide (TPR) repeat protein
MEMISLLGRGGAVVVCVMLSACVAVGPSGAADTQGSGHAYGAFLAARYADARNEPGIATKYYTEALQADPGNQALRAEGFLAALQAGSPQAAALARQVPGSTLAMMLQGNQAALNGNFARAAQLFGQLPQDDLTGLIKPLLLAWTTFGRGNTQAALSGLGSYFSGGAFGPVYVLNAALIADAAHDNKDAAQLYGAVNAGQPSLRMAQILASWQARQGEMPQAMSELAVLAQAHPDLQIALPALQAQLTKPVISTATQGMAEAYMTLAGALEQPQQRFLRVTFLRFALQLRPDLTAARLLLASTQAGGEDPSVSPTNDQMEEALATLQPVAKDDALYGPAALQQANLLAALGRPQEAVAVLDGLIAAMPGNPELLANAGDVWRNANQPAAAIGYYNRAIAAVGNPVPPGAWVLFFDRGIAEDQLGSWQAAQPDMLKALALAPNQPYVLNYLGYSWAMHGQQLDKAQAMLKEAVGLDPDDGAVIDSLGYVTLRQGDTKTAVTLLTQAVELDPDNAEVNAHLGDAFWQAGRKLQADYQWQRALALQPDAKLRAEIAGKLQQYFGPPS